MESQVKIVSITQGLGDLAGKSAQDVISYVARVSNPNNQLNFDTAPKLLKYCITHNHWSVFEQATFTVEIKTSRAIAAQILRHRSFTFQEFSQRYAQATSNTYYEARRQDQKNRQNSTDDLTNYEKTWFDVAQQRIWNTCKEAYDQAIKMGIAKEQARFLLPLSTETTIYMTGSVRSWIHYIELRCANGTQKEHMEVAEECKKILAQHFPDIASALNWA